MFMVAYFLLLTFSIAAMEKPLSRQVSQLKENNCLRLLEQLRDQAINILEAQDDVVTKALLELNALRALAETDALKIHIDRVIPLIEQPEELLLGKDSGHLTIIQERQRILTSAIDDTANQTCRGVLEKVKDYYGLFAEKLKRVDVKSEAGKAVLAVKVKMCVDHHSGDVSYKLITQEMALKALHKNKEGGHVSEKKGGGSHTVTRLGNVFFKQDGFAPLDPGMEMCMYLFYSVLFPQFRLLAPTGFLVLEDVVINGEKMCFFLQISQAIEGDSLSKVIETGQERTIDLSSLSAHLAGQLVTVSADAKPGNFQVSNENGKYVLVGIDNDEALRPAIIREPSMLHFPGFKSALACMNTVMDEFIEPRIREHLAKIVPEDVLMQWLDLLEKKNACYLQLMHYLSLFKKTAVFVEHHHAHDRFQHLKLPFCLIPGTATSMIARLKLMKEKVAEKALTHQQLFGEIMPLVERYYTIIKRQNNNDPYKSYEKINSSASPFENVIDISKPLKQNGERVFKMLRLETHGVRELENRVQTIAEAKVELQQTVFNNRLQETGSTPSHDVINEAFKQVEMGQPGSHNYEEVILNKLAIINASALLLNMGDKADNTPLDLAFKKRLPKVLTALIMCGAGTKCNVDYALECYTELKVKGLLTDDVKNAFKILRDRNAKFAWTFLLDTIFLKDPTPGAKLSAGTSFNEKRYLAPFAVLQLWDQKGNFIPRNRDSNGINYGRREVGYVETVDGKIWFKRLPNVPGFEYMVGHLLRLAIQRGAPHCELVRIGNDLFLISMDAGGKLLEDIFKEQERKDKTKDPEQIIKLDPLTTSPLILMAMVINFEDGKPDNIVVTFDGTSYHLVLIDNENAFFPEYVVDKATGKVVRRVKTTLFNLPLMMEKVPLPVREHFLRLNPLELLKTLLHDLSSFNTRSCQLYTTPEELKKLKELQCCLGVPLASGMLSRIYAKLLRLRRLLERNPEITHMDLLQEMASPELAHRYRSGFTRKAMTVYERFKMIDCPLYKSTNRGLQSNMSAADVLESQNIVFDENLMDIIKKGTHIGPVPALQELEAIRTQLTQQELGKDLASFSTLRSDVDKEEFLSTVDFGRTNSENRMVIEEASQKVLFEQTMKEVKMWRRLIVRRAVALTTPLIAEFNIDSLTKLDVSGCININEDLLPLLSKKCKWLESLNLKGLIKLRNIWLQNDRPLVFPSLKRLVLDQCNELATLLIHAPNLRTLLARQCPKLKLLTLASVVLKTLDLRSSGLVTDDVLDKVIKDCDALANLHVDGCPLITNTDVRELCPRYPATLLKDLSDHLRYLIVLLLQQDSDITFLHLGYDRYKDKEFTALCKALAFNNCVTKLHLGANPIGDEGMKALADTFRKNTSIESLNLGDINASEEGLQSLADALENNTTLTDVDFGKPAAIQIKEELQEAKRHPMMAELAEPVRQELLQKINEALGK